MRPPTMSDLEAQARAAADTGNLPELERLERAIDNLDHPGPTPALLPSALWYASQGIPVFPLQPGQKIPLPRTHGCLDATTDEALIRAWWAATPTANIGIATGHVLDVIDIDGPAGRDSWRDEVAARGLVPPILGTVDTPRGTHHYITPTGDGNAAGIWPGVDFRGAGGYVVAPPSTVGGHAYRWITPIEVPHGLG